jgi:hypothetical protein
VKDKYAILASAKYRDVAWSKSTDDGCALHATANGATAHVAALAGGTYSWRAGEASGTAPTLVDAKLAAVDAMQAGTGAGAAKYAALNWVEAQRGQNRATIGNFVLNVNDGTEWSVYKGGQKIASGSAASLDAAKSAAESAAKSKGAKFSEVAAAHYNAFGLSPLALSMLASIQKAGGTAKLKPAAGSPKAIALEELVTASAVHQNPDGSVTMTDVGARWLTQDASLKASAGPVEAAYSWIDAGGGKSAQLAGKVNMFVQKSDTGGWYWWIQKPDGSSLVRKTYASNEAAAKSAAEQAARSMGGKFSAALFAAVDADASLKACEKVCLLYAANAALERNEVTFDVIDSLLARGLVEPVGDRKTYRMATDAVAKYGANWNKTGVDTSHGVMPKFEAHAGKHALTAWTLDGSQWHWTVGEATEGYFENVKSGNASNEQSAKSAAESAARSLGAKFAAGAVEWKCVDPKATTQITSTERTALTSIRDGAGTPPDDDAVVYRTLASKGLIEMGEDGAYSITPAGTDALAGGGTADAEKASAAKQYAEVSINDIEIFPHPSSPNTHSIATVQVGGRILGVSWAGKPTRERVLEAWKTDRKSFKPYDQSTGRFIGSTSRAYSDPAKPVHATAPRIPTGEYLAIFDKESNTYTVKDVPIFAEHQVPGAKFKIGEKWMRAAVQKAKDRATADKYVAPLHVRHHGDSEGTRRAGFVMPTEVKSSMYEGRKTFVLYADLVGIPPEVYEEIKQRRLPYRSVEINKVDVPEISSLALLEDEVPYFRLPMLGVGEEVDAKGERPDIAASARRIRESANITPCVAYAESATLGRATYLYSEAGMARLTMGEMRKYGASKFAIVNSQGVITEIVASREEAEGRWGFDHELVELVKPHRVGDTIDWDAKGKEKFSQQSSNGGTQMLRYWVQQGNASIAYVGPDVALNVTPDGSGGFRWRAENQKKRKDKSGVAPTEDAAKKAAEAAGKSIYSQSGATQMRKFANLADEEKDEAVSAKMREMKLADGNEDDDEETLRAKAFAALRLADGDVCPTCGLDADDCTCPADAAAMADVLQPDEPLTEGAKEKKGSPGGQAGSSEASARQFAAMAKTLGGILAGQRQMLKMMAKAYDMKFEDDEDETVKAAAGDAPGEDEDDGPVEMKASAKMAARLTTVEGKLAKAETSAKIDKAIKYALRQLDGYSVGDPEDVEKRIRAGAMKYGEGWIKEYLADVKKLAPKAPTDGDMDGLGGESVGDLPDGVLKYRAGGPEKLERAIRHHQEWQELKRHGHGSFAKDETSERYVSQSMQYSAVDGNGVVKE